MKELKDFLNAVDGFKSWRDASKNSKTGDTWGKGGPEWGSAASDEDRKPKTPEIKIKQASK